MLVIHDSLGLPISARRSRGPDVHGAHQTVLIDPASAGQGSILEVHAGFCRVYCLCEDTEGMTWPSFRPA